MYLHANAKLGLAACFALVQAGREWLFDSKRGDAFQCLARDRASLVASLARGR